MAMNYSQYFFVFSVYVQSCEFLLCFGVSYIAVNIYHANFLIKMRHLPNRFSTAFSLCCIRGNGGTSGPGKAFCKDNHRLNVNLMGQFPKSPVLWFVTEVLASALLMMAVILVDVHIK
jgi:hypothetical protein